MAKYVLLFFSLLIMLSCEERERFLSGERQIFYKAANEIANDGVTFSAEMKASFDSDTLVVLLKSTNKRDKPVRLDMTNAEVLGKNGMVSKPVLMTQEKRVLAAGATVSDTLYFRPINDRKRFGQTDLRGRFLSSYYFIPSGITGISYSSINIELQSVESTYAAYLLETPASELVTFNIVRDENLEQGLLTVGKALAPTDQNTPSNDRREVVLKASIDDKTIVMKSMAMMMKLYSEEGQLKLLWRLRNQQATPLLLDVDSFKMVNSDGDSLQLSNVQYLESIGAWKPGQPVNQGVQVTLLLTYALSGATAEAYFLTPGVGFADQKALLPAVQLVRNK